jgi:hypothetical protein
MKTKTLRLVMEVTYDLKSTSVDFLREQLASIADAASNRGEITGEALAEVETFSYQVEDLCEDPKCPHMFLRGACHFHKVE